MEAEKENVTEFKRRRFDVNGKSVDLDSVLPLTIGDFKALKAKGCDLLKFSDDNIELESMAEIVHYVCHKSNPDVTAEDVDTLPFSWMIKIVQEASSLTGEDEGPF